MSPKLKDNLIQNSKSGLARLINYGIWFLIFILVVSTVRNIGKVTRIRGEVEVEKKKIAKMEAENKDLANRVAEIQQPEFIEKEIRDKLGLVKAGEAVVVLPDEDTLRKLAPNAEPENETLPDPNWLKWVKLFI